MATIETSIILRDNMSKIFQRITQSSRTASNTMVNGANRTASANQTLINDFNQLSGVITNTANNFNRLNGATDRYSNVANKINNTNKGMSIGFGGLFGGITSVVGAYLGMEGGKVLMNTTDDLINAKARLGLLAKTKEEQKALDTMVMQSADNARGKYLDMVADVGKLGINARNAFGNTKEIVQFSNLVQKTFRIGGANAQEQRAAITQLIQSMGAGRLQGDEFRSISENAPLLGQAIAKYMKIPIGKLKELSSQGIITAKIIKAAMFSASKDINSKFAQMPLTFTDVWNRISNAAIRAFKPMFSDIATLPDLINKMVPKFESLFGIIAKISKEMSDMAKFITKHWDVIGPLLNGLIVAFTGSKIKSAITSIASLLSTVGGWFVFGIGLLIGGIGLAITKYNKLHGIAKNATAQIIGSIAMGAAYFLNYFAFLINWFYNLPGLLLDRMILIGNIIANVFTTIIGSIKLGFLGLVRNILTALEPLIKAKDQLFHTNTSSKLIEAKNVVTYEMQQITDDTRKNMNPIPYIKWKNAVNFIDPEKWYKSSYDWMDGITKEFNSITGGLPSDLLSDIADSTAQTAENTKKDNAFLKPVLGNMQARNIVVNNTFTGNVSGDRDLDDMISRFTGSLTNAINRGSL